MILKLGDFVNITITQDRLRVALAAAIRENAELWDVVRSEAGRYLAEQVRAEAKKRGIKSKIKS
ncbi:MAG: hypothetical protein KBS70_04010, partial [Bacteroidales bacterium]|nr:hypothetical protein [Candidatus Colicola equi]